MAEKVKENEDSERAGRKTSGKDYRSAVDGEYVTEEFAKENPTTTVGESRTPREHHQKIIIEPEQSEETEPEPVNVYLNMPDESIEALVIQSEKYYRDTIKPFFENQKQILTEIHKRKGLGYLFQDEQSGAVLKTVEEQYKSVSLFNLGIHRTRFDDSETKQSLSNKEAEAAGFILKFGDRRKKK